MRFLNQKQAISLNPSPPSDAKKWEPVGYACVYKGVYTTGEDSKVMNLEIFMGIATQLTWDRTKNLFSNVLHFGNIT